jgi:hypothetical protein
LALLLRRHCEFPQCGINKWIYYFIVPSGNVMMIT